MNLLLLRESICPNGRCKKTLRIKPNAEHIECVCGFKITYERYQEILDGVPVTATKEVKEKIQAQKKKPMMDPNRAISWSQISSFEWDPEQWYQTYVLGIRQESRELTFGSEIDKRIQEDPTFLPELPRYKLMQHKMEAKIGKIKIVGLPDGLDLDAFLLADYKTGKKAWDQARAEATGQLKMYLLLVWLTEKINPENFRCFIHWLPTYERGDFTIQLVEPCVPQTFEVRITMREILEFSVHIRETVKKMEAYARTHP